MKLDFTNFFYEFRRNFGRKSVIAIMLIIIIISASLGLTLGIQDNIIRGGAFQPLPHTDYYKINGQYHVVVNAINYYGQPLKNTQVNITVTGYDNSHFTEISKTDSQGVAYFSIGNLRNLTSSNASSSNNIEIYGTFKEPPASAHGEPWGPIIPLSINLSSTAHSVNRYRMSLMENPNSRLTDWVHILRVGPQNQSTPRLGLYYEAIPSNYTGQYSQLAVENRMNYTGTISNFSAISVSTGIPYSSNKSNFIIALFSSNGTLVASTSGMVLFKFTPRQVNLVYFNGFAFELSIVVPLMGVMAGYLVYGRDRSSGVLESSASRPIRKATLILSRLSVIYAIFSVAVLISLSILSLLFRLFYYQYLPGTTFALEAIFLIGAGTSMAVIVSLISHLTRSTYRLLGASIFLFVFFYFIFTMIQNTVISSPLGFPPTSAQFDSAYILSSYLSPVGIGNLVILHVLGGYQFVTGTPSTLASYGLTLINIIISEIAWMVIPAALLLILSVRSD